MGKARVCKVVQAPALPMYRALVDWGNWGAWVDMLTGFAIESGGPGVVGSVRVGQRDDRPVTRERLVAADDANLTLTYVIDGPAPFPARDYTATVRLLPLTDGPGTVVEWVSTFYGTDPDVDAKVQASMEHIYGVFIDALAKVA